VQVYNSSGTSVGSGNTNTSGVYTRSGLPTGTYFTGTNNTYAQYSASLATWANQDIIIRWLLSSDTSVSGNGWWVDDIAITNVEVPSSCTSNPSPFPGAFGKSAPANGARKALAAAPRNHLRRSGLETSWMLGLEDRLLSSIEAKSLAMEMRCGALKSRGAWPPCMTGA